LLAYAPTRTAKRMRPVRPRIGPALLALVLPACAPPSSSGFGSQPSGSGSGGSSSGASSGSASSSSSSGGVFGGTDGGSLLGDGAIPPPPADDAGVTVQTTIYAHTDDTLYSMDPQTKATTQIGTFAGVGGTSTDKAVTDLAVNANGDVYVNTESVVYRAALPSAPPGTVTLTRVAALQTSDRFYALAFAPAGALDPANETLVGGDGNGELWAIDTTTGATTDLGHFGNDPSTTGNVFALSGDLVFYDDSTGAPTGLATIRSCPAGGSTSQCSKDYLAGVDMGAMKTAYANKAPAASLLSGVYGGSGSSPGAGTGYADVFGLGAWQGSVFGFTRHTSAAPPTLISIDSNSGAATPVATFTFPANNGWSGAGVTTKVTVNVPKPPPPPQ
jgi:hypothetical protein